MEWLNGYRTIGCIILSAVLSILSRKGLINPDSGVTGAQLWDLIATNYAAVASIVASVAAVWFRLRSVKPGALAPQA